MRSVGRPRRGSAEPSVVRVALTRFAVLALLGLVVVASVTAYMSQHLARDEAVRDARSRTVGIAEGIAAPLVTEELRRGDPRAVRRLDAALRNRMRDGSVSHLVVWEVDGDVLWSDDTSALDHDDPLPVSLVTGAPGEQVFVDLDDPAGTFVRPGPRAWVEVYVRTRGADGEPFIFETYTPRDRLQADSGAVMGELLPLTLGSLGVLAVLIAPLAWSLARRIDRSNASRREVLRRSVRSWQWERERLAQTLHDDVIQDLSALGYALPAVLEPLPDTPAGQAARRAGHEMNQALVHSVRMLRTMLTDLAPSGFEYASLARALQEVAQHHRDRGLDVDLVSDADLCADVATGILVYRVVREGLHNVAKHAGATRATARLSHTASGVEVIIDDDGCGPPQPHVSGRDHVGLRLLGQVLEEVGGSLDLMVRPGGGARLRAVVPRSFEEQDDIVLDEFVRT